jgi:prevent-host-death family protein
VQINVFEAKTQLSRLLAAAEAGEEVIIARDGRPVVRLVPVRAERPVRQPGTLRGRIHIGADFDDPLPPDLAAAFGTA